MTSGGVAFTPNESGTIVGCERNTDIWLVGNPASKRARDFTLAAERVRGFRLKMIPYAEVLRGSVRPPPAGTIVRLESPADSDEVWRLLLKAGISPLEARGIEPLRPTQIDQLSCERGEILHPLQWYLGFRQFLINLAAAWNEPGIYWMSTPASIVTSFDKQACLDLWSRSGLPVPYQYRGPTTYAAIRQAVQDRHARLFIKLRFGYSAIGAVALEWRDNKVRAITTVEVVWSDGRPRLFLSKRPRQLLREFDIAWLIDTLGMEEIIVEDWLPKARLAGRPFDVRLLTIGGVVQHVVGRANDTPFTNLNLDATRIPKEQVISHVDESWFKMKSLCERAASLIPGAGMLGIDILVRPGGQKFAILEANAFGDYLPGLLHHGQSTHEAQLRALHPLEVMA